MYRKHEIKQVNAYVNCALGLPMRCPAYIFRYFFPSEIVVYGQRNVYLTPATIFVLTNIVAVCLSR